MAVQYFILGGIISLTVMAAGAVYWQAVHLKKEQQPAGQIGTSFEQAEVAGEHHDFLPSRHMPSTPTPSPAASPESSPASQP